MINGIMKLFYTEVVKSKISKLPNEQYEINSKFKKVQEISAKIDTILLYTLKILVAVAILLFSYKINIYFGIGVFLTEIIYVLYKKSLKPKVVSEIENIKNNISESILTPLGNNFLNFSVLVDGTLEILDGAGQYLAAGQNLLGNVELLANMIPGVDFSLKLLPMTEKAIDAYFDIFSLGKDWQMVVGEIKGGLEQLGN